jgi:hypothetical protein
MKHAALFILFSGVAFAAGATTFTVQSKIEHASSYHLSAPTTVQVLTNDGNIKAKEVSGNDVKLNIKNSTGQAATVKVEQGKNGQLKFVVHIEPTTVTSSISFIRGVNVNVTTSFTSGTLEIELGLPKHLLAHFRAQTEDGDIHLVGAFDDALKSERKIDLITEDGNITCLQVCATGTFLLKTKDGDIAIAHTIGDAKVTSDDGSLRAENITGHVELKTDDGNIEARQNRGNLSAVSGDGNIRIVGQSGGSVYARTDDGDIELNNPMATAQDAKTGDGDISGNPREQRGKCEKNLVSARATDPFDF